MIIFKKAYILIIFLIISCTPKIISNIYVGDNNRLVEHLNIHSFKWIENKETNDKKITSSFIKENNGIANWIKYSEFNKVTNETIKINGNEKRGYYKEVTSTNDPILKAISFYPSGNIRSTGSTYIGYQKDFAGYGHISQNGIFQTGEPRFQFPVGTSYFYDENGNITETKDFDEGFDLTFDELMTKLFKSDSLLLNKKAFHIEKRSIDAMEYWVKNGTKFDFDIEKQCPCWSIGYKFEKAQDSSYIVNGKNGNIIFRTGIEYIE